MPGVVALPDGDFRKVAANYLLPVKPLSETHRAVFLRWVRSHHDAPDLPRLDWSKQWIANCRACEEGPGNILRYLARYTKRGPLPEKSVVSISDERIVFRYTSHRTGRSSLCKLAPEEFLRRYLQHTPPSGFHRIRYFGLPAPACPHPRTPIGRFVPAALSFFLPSPHWAKVVHSSPSGRRYLNPSGKRPACRSRLVSHSAKDTASS